MSAYGKWREIKSRLRVTHLFGIVFLLSPDLYFLEHKVEWNWIPQGLYGRNSLAKVAFILYYYQDFS